MPPTIPNKPSWLLLLPSVPPNISIDVLRAAYGPAISLALCNASQSSCTSAPITLDIAVAYDPFIPLHGQAPTIVYYEVQKILKLMYSLLCILSMEEPINSQYDKDVDVRVLVLGTGQTEDDQAIRDKIGSEDHSNHLRALAMCRRPWTRFCFIENQSGEAMLANFRRLRKNTDHMPQAHFEGLPGGWSINASVERSSLNAAPPKQLLHSHCSVAVGGTFDHLHAGHKLLLTIAALLINFRGEPNRAKSLTIGISGDALLQKKRYIDEMLDWNGRQSGVREFVLGLLEMSQPSEKLKTSLRPSSESGARSINDEFESGLVIRYAELFDAYGPTVTDKSISALVISRETRAGGKAVNDQRVANGWPTLEIFEVDVLDAEGRAADGVGKEDFRGKISSTDIRRRLHERSASTTLMEGQKHQDD